MKPILKEEGERWLKQAESDLEDAQYNSEGGRYNVACFLGQQAAEKALKGYLYTKGDEEVWGHSVAELCTRAISFDSQFKSFKKTAAPLDKYYIPTRYPNALPGGIPKEAFDAEDAKRAISTAKVVIEFVTERI